MKQLEFLRVKINEYRQGRFLYLIGGSMPAYSKKTYYHAEIFWKSGRRSQLWKFEKPKLRSSAIKNIKKNDDYLGHRTWEKTE